MGAGNDKGGGQPAWVGGRGSFREVDEDVVRRVEGWAFSVPVVAATATQAYLHGDLAGDNVFVLPSGYRVVDWQRPFRGPADLDLATWLESFGLDPLRHLAEGVVWTLYLLRLAWFTECAVRWFPEGIPDYDGQIARLAMMLGRETGEA